MEIKNLTVDEVECFSNSRGEGVILSWSANIGFGELTIYKRNADEKWHVDTECMGKDFAQMVLNKWVDDMEVE